MDRPEQHTPHSQAVDRSGGRGERPIEREAGTRANRGRGRGGRGRRERQKENSTKRTPSQLLTGAENGQLGTRLTDAAFGSQAISRGRAQSVAQSTDGEEVCFICASPVVHHAVAPCNHRTCHICALRLRALYKTKACAHCRVSILESAPCTSHF